MENKKIDMKTGNEKAEDSIPGNRCINEAVLPGKQKEKTKRNNKKKKQERIGTKYGIYRI